MLNKLWTLAFLRDCKSRRRCLNASTPDKLPSSRETEEIHKLIKIKIILCPPAPQTFFQNIMHSCISRYMYLYLTPFFITEWDNITVIVRDHSEDKCIRIQFYSSSFQPRVGTLLCSWLLLFNNASLYKGVHVHLQHI